MCCKALARKNFCLWISFYWKWTVASEPWIEITVSFFLFFPRWNVRARGVEVAGRGNVVWSFVRLLWKKKWVISQTVKKSLQLHRAQRKERTLGRIMLRRIFSSLCRISGGRQKTPNSDPGLSHRDNLSKKCPMTHTRTLWGERQLQKGTIFVHMSFYCDFDVVNEANQTYPNQLPSPHRPVPPCYWPTWCSWNSRCCSWNSAPSLASKCDLTLLTPSSPHRKALWLLSPAQALQNTAAK